MSDKAVRSIGSATIAFGMVACPVKVYSATDTSSKISFNLLHKCGSRVKQQYTCANEGRVIERADMVKGYEYAKDTFVKFTSEELKKLEEKASYTIDITEFVPIEKIDPIYFDGSFYLGPDRGGARAYTLLIEAMKRSGRAAIAKYASRGKDYTVMLRPVGNCLVMQTLLYDTEVRSTKEIPLDPVDAKDAEIDLALQLVDSLAKPGFDPGQYKDSVQERIAAAIQQKIEGKELTISAPEAAPQIVDIMEALKASLGAKKK